MEGSEKQTTRLSTDEIRLVQDIMKELELGSIESLESVNV